MNAIVVHHMVVKYAGIVDKMYYFPLQLFNEDVTNQCGVLLNNPNSLYIGAWNFTSCADTQAVAICQRKGGEYS